MGSQPPPQKGGGTPCPIFGPFLLWPNGWMYQDVTWYGGTPQPRRLCVTWGPSSLPKKGRSLPIFATRLLWPNSCMDQDATWYGGRPRPTRHCVRWGPSFPSPKGAQLPCQFSANVHCGQTTGWTKMPLGMEDGLGPGAFVFDGEPATPRRKSTPHSPNFWPMSILAKWLDGRRCHLVRK